MMLMRDDVAAGRRRLHIVLCARQSVKPPRLRRG